MVITPLLVLPDGRVLASESGAWSLHHSWCCQTAEFLPASEARGHYTTPGAARRQSSCQRVRRVVITPLLVLPDGRVLASESGAWSLHHSWCCQTAEF
ncbi:hypothetical protein [Escherichia coli]|uniref:hypothetical protein n=1 Tax=Escherichia coli TaxID=562 RepID=UPI0013B3FDB3|nr:hypothetical protein [Escherichia coli]